jgi:hypothetical protein
MCNCSSGKSAKQVSNKKTLPRGFTDLVNRCVVCPTASVLSVDKKFTANGRFFAYQTSMSLFVAVMLFVFGSIGLKPALADADQSPCVVREEVFSKERFKVGVTKFTPSNISSKAVIIVPPTGGTTRIDLSYGKALCKKNITAIVMDRWSDDQEYNLELEIHDRFYRRAQAAIDIVIDNISEKKIGILGTSVGASHAAIASQRTDRIDALFLIVGGAPISSILVNSDQEILVDAKKKRFKMFGFHSLDEYELALKKVIPFEPLSMFPAKHIPHFGMAISNSDGTVPTRNQVILKDAWKPALVLESDYGHIGTILKMWLCNKSEVVNFFDENL